MMVVAVVGELLFRARLEAAAAQRGVPLRIVADAQGACRALAEAPGAQVLIDLNLIGPDPIAIVQALREADPTARLLGYCSHVQTELAARARQAGCEAVLARSELVQRLPELMTSR